MAQTPTVVKWGGAHLQQRGTLFTSPLQTELQAVLGPVSYASEPLKGPHRQHHGQRAAWTAVAIQRTTDTIRYDAGGS
jgi:hypothetical protein